MHAHVYGKNCLKECESAKEMRMVGQDSIRFFLPNARRTIDSPPKPTTTLRALRARRLHHGSLEFVWSVEGLHAEK